MEKELKELKGLLSRTISESLEDNQISEYGEIEIFMAYWDCLGDPKNTNMDEYYMAAHGKDLYIDNWIRHNRITPEILKHDGILSWALNSLRHDIIELAVDMGIIRAS